MNNYCLLVKTPDKRKFLVSEKNMQSIIEYVKTFHAEVYRVEVLEGKIISQLKNLAGAICDPDYNTEMKIQNAQKLYPKTRPRNSILKNAKKIRDFINNRFSSGKSVSLKDLKKRYKNCEITDACLCNHLSAVRKQLIRNGRIIKKIGQGKYCLGE
jgi:phage pi2 protein 07